MAWTKVPAPRGRIGNTGTQLRIASGALEGQHAHRVWERSETCGDRSATAARAQHAQYAPERVTSAGSTSMYDLQKTTIFARACAPSQDRAGTCAGCAPWQYPP